MEFVDGRFSAPTTLRLAFETLGSLEELHSIGYVHRDVKVGGTFYLQQDHFMPQIFLSTKKTVKLKFTWSILAYVGRIKTTMMKLDRREKRPNSGSRSTFLRINSRGTTRYASLAAHNEQELAPRDDLESWLYMIIEFMTDKYIFFANLIIFRRTSLDPIHASG